MKSRFYAILTLLVLFLSVSCGRHKGEFVLQGTVNDDTDTILVIGLDSRFESIDTIVSVDGQFKWSLRPDTVTTLILVFPDGRRHPVFAEKDVNSTIYIPSDTGLFSVSGGPCNEAYQSFYMASVHDTASSQTFARIDSFITRDPFSEVTPYIIYSEMVQRYHAGEDEITAKIERMSGNMQDAPYLASLKTEFKGKLSNNVFISAWELRDSTGKISQISNIGTSNDHILTCVWASWDGSRWADARKSMDSLRLKYEGRNLVIMDVAIDVNVNEWKRAITTDTLEWTSYVDPRGWESRVIKGCGITRIPVYVLLSGTKRVVKVSTSLDDMDKELKKVLPQAVKPVKTTKNTKTKK